MPPISRVAFLAASLVFTSVLVPVPAQAQSVMSGTISGTVSETDGRPVARARITLRSLDAGSAKEAIATGSGSFEFALVPPGSYELRAEALGYRPVVTRGLTLGGGDRIALDLSLSEVTPPVVSVDTVEVAGASASRWSAGAERIAGPELTEQPYRHGTLGEAAALAGGFDGSLGARGLPGTLTVVVADGIPTYRAAHPLQAGEHLADALFPTSLLSSVAAVRTGGDVEWGGSPSGYLSLSSRTGVPGGVAAEGGWSGGPLWSSRKLDVSSPELMSIHGLGMGEVALKPDTVFLLVAAEALQLETPRAAQIPGTLSSALSGLDPALLVAVGSPSVERASRVSGLARLYAEPSATSRLFLRGSMAHSTRTFDGMDPPFAPATFDLPEESTEFSIAGSFLSQPLPGLELELRGGISGSDRSFEPTLPDLPSAYLVEEGIALGTTPGGAAETSRTDVVLMPIARYRAGPGLVKAGAALRAATHTISHSTTGAGDFLFTDAAALLAGRGAARVLSGPEASFSTRELGGFLQYDMTPSAGLRATLGARFDYEMLPSDEVRLSEAWLDATGIRNDEHPTSFPQIGAVASISWDPTRDGRTLLYGVAALHHGDLDPRTLQELFSQDGDASGRSYVGAGLGWADGSVPGTATARTPLTLLGPDARAPQSFSASAGLVREFGRGFQIHLGADWRRTDFLMRRRNLNLPALPRATDSYGRDVWAGLDQDRALVTANASEVRRFSGFEAVWALDPDGWSEHRAATIGLERSGERLDMHASYTRSETRDNWIGAARRSPGAELSPLLPEGTDWGEGRSDFDVPHQVAASAILRLPEARTTLSATYGYRSGLPFTPRYRRGVDANGDGSYENDVAWVPDAAQLGALTESWSCLADQTSSFAVRNSCRADGEHGLSARARFDVGRIAGLGTSLVVEAFNLVEGGGGVIDDALLLVDPSTPVTYAPDGQSVAVPVLVNPDFGRVLIPSSRGTMLRLSLRIGGAR